MRWVSPFDIVNAPAKAPDPVSIRAPQDNYFALVGAGISQYNAPIAVGWVTFGIKLGVHICTSEQTPLSGCVGSIYSMTTIEMTGQKSQIRQGMAMVLGTSGRWSLIALVDGGTSTAPSMVGSFSGGGMLAYRMKGIIFTAGVKAVTDGSQVKPTIEIGVGKSF